MTLYEKIHALGLSRGMSIPKLEQALGFGNGTIGRWKAGSATVSKLIEVADYFGISLDELTDRTDRICDDVAIDLQYAIQKLEKPSDQIVIFDGKVMSLESRNLCLDSLRIIARTARYNSEINKIKE